MGAASALTLDVNGLWRFQSDGEIGDVWGEGDLLCPVQALHIAVIEFPAEFHFCAAVAENAVAFEIYNARPRVDDDFC